MHRSHRATMSALLLGAAAIAVGCGGDDSDTVVDPGSTSSDLPTVTSAPTSSSAGGEGGSIPMGTDSSDVTNGGSTRSSIDDSTTSSSTAGAGGAGNSTSSLPSGGAGSIGPTVTTR